MYFYQEHIFLSKSKIKIKTCFLVVVINFVAYRVPQRSNCSFK